ncbi:orotidine-5'-phosphate decarboxylase [Kangiella profundi]|uniref:Orotidine 5'-phosphate decarboxylase n=1 Tax=Kangiella profundi TaxID=1561924 RepID=A0A2K9AAN2_9GAMM|nr:orotidine-5'-phosphate decarboxylase [Kangiella profundi]AUD78487.1 orotidine-5'-phosphate decarboxylase [Kangiella profundi]GGF08286.1 orotidine 5'-phosphate decarboxylase [Kangiella profundi]
MSDPKILVALDYDNQQQALQLVDQLKPNLCGLKVGKEMFTLFGPEFVKTLVNKGFKVFLDLKFHDIPNTVAKACKAAAELGVWMVNVHASGGSKMMHAAREALEGYENRPLLIAVTLLTSMDEVAYSEIGFKRDLPEQVEHLAGIAKSAGLDGVVCSAWEARRLKEQLGTEFKLVTPGIRPPGSEIGDQSRIMTPEQAVVAGSDYLVIGRPITKASDPLKALYEISESIVS